MDLLPELRWTAAALPATELTLVAVFSPEDQTVRASGVAVPEDSEPPAAAIGRLLETLMDRLVALDPETADREMNPRPVEPRPGVSQPVADALAAYAAGDVAALDALDVTQPGTAFRQRAWRELRGIAPGSPATYGGACAANLVAVVVPCHRVVRADGAAGHYLYGTAAKQALLAHEAARAG